MDQYLAAIRVELHRIRTPKKAHLVNLADKVLKFFRPQAKQELTDAQKKERALRNKQMWIQALGIGSKRAFKTKKPPRK